jgi:antitoxin HicB
LEEPQTFNVVLEPQEEGGFLVLVPALPEVVTEGDTEVEALEMAREAIALAIEHRRDRGEPVPPGSSSKLRQVTVSGTA